jgi:hypothetical protein
MGGLVASLAARRPTGVFPHAGLVDALAGDTGSRSIATGNETNLADGRAACRI